MIKTKHSQTNVLDDFISKEEFDKLPRQEQRVLIAKDVLKWLDSGKFIPTRGIFWSPNRVAHDIENAKEFMLRKDVECEVCAKGAIMCAHILRFNKCDIYEMCVEHESFKDIFGGRYYDYIESLYEGFFECGFGFLKNKRISVQAMTYYKGNLKALMKNIIKHKGKLVIGGKVIFN